MHKLFRILSVTRCCHSLSHTSRPSSCRALPVIAASYRQMSSLHSPVRALPPPGWGRASTAIFSPTSPSPVHRSVRTARQQWETSVQPTSTRHNGARTRRARSHPDLQSLPFNCLFQGNGSPEVSLRTRKVLSWREQDAAGRRFKWREGEPNLLPRTSSLR